MDPLITAERYTHGVRLSGYSRETLYKMQRFLDTLLLREPTKVQGRMVMVTKKKYYGITEDNRSIFIHRNSYAAMVAHLANVGVPEDRIKVIDIPVPYAAPATFVVKEKFSLRDYQKTILEDILRAHLHSARVDLQTGKGKTYTSLEAQSALGCRTVIMVPPKYFGIWEEALKDVYEDIDLRYVRVSGSAELQMMINRGIEDDLAGIDVILISNVTYRAYLDTFERLGDKIDTVGYNAPPPRFHEALKVGLQINDEIQEDPGLLFRTDMYTNVAKQIYLSATPFTGNDYVTKMIDLMLPPETACRLPSYDSYINVVGVLYSEPEIQSRDYLTPFKNTYNHARYETQMMKSKKRLERYNQMVARILYGQYIVDRIQEQKALVLCATTAFIDQLVKFLKEKYPDLQINEHYSGSPYSRLMENDITVSTIKSSGTGVDIPNLRELILLQATDSKKDNIQILGRLRKLKLFADVIPRMTYLVCQHIPQHVKYHRSKADHFLGKALNMALRKIS
ncbi:DNA helicase [Pseudomonas phage Psa21]|uniref:Putative RAD2/SF2 helicase n=1 Tax=Pseudomonas phage Psa21 TaxID=2530023 RepID=A0A481W4F7_9CAUD|nr:DNA helicase [Pseudomonas phage Psa21]QBJ02606.1 putative RAD2/SF2 helicase [Pseudomonas phage Psa21]